MKKFFCLKKISVVYFLILALFLISFRNYSDTVKSNSGTEPNDALSTFELEPGFKIELLANEPLISDPVDMEIDYSTPPSSP